MQSIVTSAPSLLISSYIVTKVMSSIVILTPQIDDERKNWLSERAGKSHESKRLIVTMKIEIEEANKRNKELENKSQELARWASAEKNRSIFMNMIVRKQIRASAHFHE